MKSAGYRFAGFAFLSVGLVVHAQGGDRPRIPAPGTTMFRPPSVSGVELAASARVTPASCSELAGLVLIRPDPERDALADLFSDEPPQLTRAELEGGSATPLRYGELPGGIVLGLRAHPVGVLAGDVSAGAHVERLADGRLGLRLGEERTLLLPFIEPATLGACLEFVTAGAGSNSLVDLCAERPRFAPAFTGRPLEALLVQQDRVPHRVHAVTCGWKSLILDRDVRMEARGSELVLSADLEVRFYSPYATGAADESSAGVQSLLTLDLARPELADMAAELRPLSGLAAWIGFLRWATSADPRGIAALRTGLRKPSLRGPGLEPRPRNP